MRIVGTLYFYYDVNPEHYDDDSSPTDMLKSDMKADPAMFFETVYSNKPTVSGRLINDRGWIYE